MRRAICLTLYTAMMVGGATLVYVQLFLSPVIKFWFVGGSGMLIFLGGYLLWEAFIAPLLGIKGKE